MMMMMMTPTETFNAYIIYIQEIFDTYIIYIAKVLTRLYKNVLTDKICIYCSIN